MRARRTRLGQYDKAKAPRLGAQDKARASRLGAHDRGILLRQRNLCCNRLLTVIKKKEEKEIPRARCRTLVV